MTSPGLPPLISSDGHLEVRPERWTQRMPAKHREHAPRTIKLPDGGDALLVEGQPPYPAPFLDLRAGRTNETWEPFGVTVDDTAGVGPPEQRLKEQDMDALHAEVLFPNMQVGPRLWRAIADEDVYRATVRAYNDWLGEEYCTVSRDRLIGLGVLPSNNVTDATAQPEHCMKLGLKGVNLGWVPFWMEEADYWYERHRHWAARLLNFKPLKQRPSEYVRQHIFFSVQHVERVAIELRHHMGVDRIMFATDFPHIECDWPNTRPFAERLFAGVPADEAFKIAARNMLEYFRLEATPMGRKVLAAA